MTIRGLEGRGAVTRVQLSGTPDVIVVFTPAAVADLDLRRVAALWAKLKATEIRTYPA